MHQKQPGASETSTYYKSHIHIFINSYKFYDSGVITRRKKYTIVGLQPEEYNSFKGKEAYSRNFSELWIGTQNHGKQKKA